MFVIKSTHHFIFVYDEETSKTMIFKSKHLESSKFWAVLTNTWVFIYQCWLCIFPISIHVGSNCKFNSSTQAATILQQAPMRRTQNHKPPKRIKFTDVEEASHLINNPPPQRNGQRPPVSMPAAMNSNIILGPKFFQVDALQLAPRLLGKFLKRDDVVLQITEVVKKSSFYHFLRSTE